VGEAYRIFGSYAPMSKEANDARVRVDRRTGAQSSATVTVPQKGGIAPGALTVAAVGLPLGAAAEAAWSKNRRRMRRRSSS